MIGKMQPPLLGPSGAGRIDEDAMTEAGARLHVPVMLKESLRLLDPQPGETIVDGTLGAGGHSRAILAALGAAGRLIGVDRDPQMAQIAREKLLGVSAGAKIVILTGHFGDLPSVLAPLGVEAVDGVLLDLGVASPQLDDASRGLSYRADGPLDMRLTPDAELSAEEWINQVSQEELAQVLREYGEERFSGRIARAIVEARARKPIRRTAELAEIIMRSVPRGPRRLHPARRSFQALRIRINEEMQQLERCLATLPRLLKPGGRCAIISYHSLEDRRVKNAFRDGAQEGIYELLTRKPMRPSAEETAANPRSRSAKLRAARRTESYGNNGNHGNASHSSHDSHSSHSPYQTHGTQGTLS
jgi:16S rRNA (cytosine1402-N4)-methyltransferase